MHTSTLQDDKQALDNTMMNMNLPVVSKRHKICNFLHEFLQHPEKQQELQTQLHLTIQRYKRQQ